MIYVEVIKSSDPLALGVYEFEFDQISIGRSKKNDLIFTEREIPLRHLQLKMIGDQLIIQSLNKASFYCVNNKKISGTLKLKPDDIIGFGENQIRVIKSAQTNKAGDLSLDFDKFSKNSPELKFALEFIEEIIVDLEKDTHV